MLDEPVLESHVLRDRVGSLFRDWKGFPHLVLFLVLAPDFGSLRLCFFSLGTVKMPCPICTGALVSKALVVVGAVKVGKKVKEKKRPKK